MTLTPNLEGLVDEGDKVLKTLLAKAYQRGAADMQARILSAAGELDVIDPAKDKSSKSNGFVPAPKPKAKPKQAKAKKTTKPATGARGRAPRGALDAALNRALTDNPGLRIRDYEKLVREIEPKASVTSVGNTLRRLKGKKYRSQGDRWFLMKK